MKQGIVGKRIEQAVKHMLKGEYENALIHTCIAIDRTAKKKWPSYGVGQRIRAYINEYETFIYYVFSRGTLYNDGGKLILQGKELPELLQKLIRNTLLHGDDLEKYLLLDVTNPTVLGVVDGKPAIGYGIIDGLIFSVVVDPINASETCDPNLHFGAADTMKITINLAWGDIDYFSKGMLLPKDILCKHKNNGCP